METVSLADFRSLNEQLAALVEAGVPIDAGLPAGGRSAAATLEQIQTTVARRVNRGESLEDALEGDDEAVPRGYRSLVELGLHSQSNLAAGFDGASRVASSADQSRAALEAALVYPLVVCVMAYAGLIVLCTYFVPSLEGMHESLRLTPGIALRVLTVLRDAMPFWIMIVPLLLVTLIAWRIRAGQRRRATGTRTGGLAGWLPGASAALHQERCARFAEALAGLLDDGLPLAKAVQVAADASGDGQLRDGVEQLSTALEGGELPSVDSSTAKRFPPFLRWAIWQSEGATSRVQALENASRVYRNAAKRRGRRLGTLAPMVALVVFGGTVSLLYGLALFAPMVELLRALAK